MTEDHDLQRTRPAYRQAGYAAARHIQGRRPIALSLAAPSEPAPEPETRRRPPADLAGSSRHRIELEILAVWAGLLAESRACFGDRPPPEGWGRQWEYLRVLGSRVTKGDEENDAYLEWLRHRALNLIGLEGMWDSVEAVASALLERGSLDAQETARIASRTHLERRRGTGSWFGRARHPG